MGKELFQNFANSLADKGLSLHSKVGSILSLLPSFGRSESIGSALSSDDIVIKMSEQLLNELTLYRKQLFPVLKTLQTDISAKAPLISGSQNPAGVSVKEIKVPNILIDLKKEGIIDSSSVYNNQGSIPSSINFNMDIDGIANVKEYFEGSEFPCISTITEITAKYSDLELKEFMKKYCNLIFSSYSASEFVKDGKSDYRSLGVNGSSMILYTDEIILMYGFVCKMISSPVSTNLSVNDYNVSLKVIKEDLETMLGSLLGRYETLIKAKILAVTREGLPGQVLVISELLPEYLDQASIDAWGALHALAPVVYSTLGASKGFTEELGDFTIQNILAKEEELVKRYTSFVNKVGIINHNQNVNNLRNLYVASARNAWESMVPDEIKEDLCEYTSTEDVLAKVDEYLSSIKDGDLLQVKQEIGMYIVGKIFFGKTNFYNFIINTSGEKIFRNFSSLSPEDSVTVSGIMLVVSTLISELEVE